MANRSSEGWIVLQRRKNKDCVYLVKGKCSLEHSKKPAICKAFDCREESFFSAKDTGSKVWIIGKTLTGAK